MRTCETILVVIGGMGLALLFAYGCAQAYVAYKIGGGG